MFARRVERGCKSRVGKFRLGADQNFSKSFTNIFYAGVAQLVERHVANVIVVGSTPITRSILFPDCVMVAQQTLTLLA